MNRNERTNLETTDFYGKSKRNTHRQTQTQKMNYTRTHLERTTRPHYLLSKYSDNGHFLLGWIPNRTFSNQTIVCQDTGLKIEIITVEHVHLNNFDFNPNK